MFSIGHDGATIYFDPTKISPKELSQAGKLKIPKTSLYELALKHSNGLRVNVKNIPKALSYLKSAQLSLVERAVEDEQGKGLEKPQQRGHWRGFIEYLNSSDYVHGKPLPQLDDPPGIADGGPDNTAIESPIEPRIPAGSHGTTPAGEVTHLHSDLVNDFAGFMKHRTFIAPPKKIPNGAEIVEIKCDLFEKERRNLIEAKSDTSLSSIWEGFGQVLVYGLHYAHHRKALLLPSRPTFAGLEGLLRRHGVYLIWRSKSAGFEDNCEGHLT